MKKSILIIVLIFSSFYAKNINYYIQNGKKVYLYKVSNETRSLQNDTTWYQKDSGDIIGVKKSFFLKIDTDTKIDNLLKEYNLTVIKRLSKELFLLKSDTKDTLSLLHNINSLDLNIYAYPNISKQVDMR